MPAAVLSCALAACVTHRVDPEPIEIKPIHITMDINLRVQRELEEFFAFEDGPQREPADDRQEQGRPEQGPPQEGRKQDTGKEER